MKILLVSATNLEIAPLLEFFTIPAEEFSDGMLHINRHQHELTILVTGVGMVSTAYHLGKLFATSSFDLALNAGIAGSYDPSIPIGEVVNVVQDTFAEMGAEKKDEFIPLSELKIGGKATAITFFSGKFLPDNIVDNPDFHGLRKVRGITANTIHGNEPSITKSKAGIKPSTETMEGAAFFHACHEAGIPCLQLRSISNYVEERDPSRWNIPLAVSRLNQTLISLITQKSKVKSQK